MLVFYSSLNPLLVGLSETLNMIVYTVISDQILSSMHFKSALKREINCPCSYSAVIVM